MVYCDRKFPNRPRQILRVILGVVPIYEDFFSSTSALYEFQNRCLSLLVHCLLTKMRHVHKHTWIHVVLNYGTRRNPKMPLCTILCFQISDKKKKRVIFRNRALREARCDMHPTICVKVSCTNKQFLDALNVSENLTQFGYYLPRDIIRFYR